MKNLKPLFLIKLFFLAVIVLLCACNQEKTIKYFLLNPDELQKSYDRCVTLDGKLSGHDSNECTTVLQAVPLFRAYLTEFINTPSQFGMSIMRAQIKLVQLQKEYKAALQNKNDQTLINNLKQAIAIQELEIQSRFAIIRLTTK